MSNRVAATPLIPDEIKARQQELKERAEQAAEKALEDERDRYQLVNAGNLMEDSLGNFDWHWQDKEYFARAVNSMADYKRVLAEMEEKAEKIEQADKQHWDQWSKAVPFKRGWRGRLEQPPAGIRERFGDAWQPAVNIFLAADIEAKRVATELAGLAATDPGFARQIVDCLRGGIRPVAQDRWLVPLSAPALLPPPVEGQASEPTLESVGCLEGGSGDQSVPEARKLLTGWRAICDALGEKYASRTKIGSLNDRLGGPIMSRGKGTQPMVYQDELIEWWNKLAVRAQELENRREGARLSAEAQHNYGQSGTVAPELGGGVKTRRRDKRT
jgi:hypothetical protein